MVEYGFQTVMAVEPTLLMLPPANITVGDYYTLELTKSPAPSEPIEAIAPPRRDSMYE